MAFRLSFSLLSLILLCLANTSESFREPKVQAFLHPIYKDKATKLYSLPLAVGTAFSRDFVIDFNGAAPLLLNCATAVKSTSYHSIRCDSTRCKFANPNTSCPKNITNNKPTCRKYVSTSLSARPVNARLLRDTQGRTYGQGYGFTCPHLILKFSSVILMVSMKCLQLKNILYIRAPTYLHSSIRHWE